MTQTQSLDTTAASAPPEESSAAPGRAKGRRAWLLRLGGTLAFLLLFALLVWRGTIDLGAVLHTLLAADPGLVLLSVALYGPFLLVKAERWRQLAVEMGMPIGRLEALRLYAIGLGAGAFTPGQSGDLVKAWALRSRGYPLATAIWSSVLDRLFDLAGLALLALLGVWVFGRELVGDSALILLLAAGATAGVLAIARRDVLLRYVPALSRLMGPAGQHRSFRPSALALTAGLTAVSFAISVYRVWLLAQAVSVSLSLAHVAGASALATVAALVPLSVGGVGTRDTILIVLFARLGETENAALAVSTLLLGLNASHALAGYAAWFFSPRKT